MGHYRNVYSCGHVEQCRCPGGEERKLDYPCGREECEPAPPKPTQAEADALRTLLRSEWFEQEMENGNYHSAYSFLGELFRDV